MQNAGLDKSQAEIIGGSLTTHRAVSSEWPGLGGLAQDKDGLDKGQKWYGPNRSRRY